jgi:hypothetical protein
MIRRISFLVILLLVLTANIFSQEREQGYYPTVIRGEVYADLEPIYGGYVDEEYPLDVMSASRRALEEAAVFYSAMIYGWSFHYEIGEKARQIDEILEIIPVELIQFGDPGLRVTEVEIKDMQLRLWTDYHLNESQQRRMQVWRTGIIRNIQAVGYSPVESPESFPANQYPGWLAVKKSALEDAARIALRTSLQASERNRPKEVTGYISLASFPNYYITQGRWAVSARFRFYITEIIPFAVF